MTAAEGLVAEITARLERGDAADDLRARLAEQVAEIGRRAAETGDTLPEATRVGIARLVSGIRAASTSGEAWLARTAGPEADPPPSNERFLRAYGLWPRDP